jgi:hypothetical protein
MPIRPFLSDEAFSPETIDSMSEALRGVCEALWLTMLRRGLSPRRSIELAQRGVADAATLQALTLKAFKYK